MRYEQLDSLKIFLKNVDESLLREDARSAVTYPQADVPSWNVVNLDKANGNLLQAVSGSANVYFIFTASQGTVEFELRYIGKTTKKLARQRVRNHLIKKSDGTGSKLEKVKSHVKSGGKVKISYVEIEPESLRNYIEEELIALHQEADWNRENA